LDSSGSYFGWEFFFIIIISLLSYHPLIGEFTLSLWLEAVVKDWVVVVTRYWRGGAGGASWYVAREQKGSFPFERCRTRSTFFSVLNLRGRRLLLVSLNSSEGKIVSVCCDEPHKQDWWFQSGRYFEEEGGG
jgi:hypothetical protein